MSLTLATIAASVKTTFANVASIGTSQLGPVTTTYSLSPLAAIADQGYASQLSIAAAATVTIDLASFVDPQGSTIVGVKAVSILLLPTGAGAICKVFPHATNGFSWFMNGTTPFLTIPAGGHLSYSEPAGTTINPTTAHLLDISNTGSGAMVLTVVILVHD